MVDMSGHYQMRTQDKPEGPAYRILAILQATHGTSHRNAEHEYKEASRMYFSNHGTGLLCTQQLSHQSNRHKWESILRSGGTGKSLLHHSAS